MKCLVLPQFDMPCFDNHGRPAAFQTETETEWIWGGGRMGHEEEMRAECKINK